MDELKKHKTKWWYWFIFAVAVIAVYKLLDSFGPIMDFCKNFIEVIAPFLAGVLIAYLLYLPAKGMERGFKKSRFKLVRN